MAPTPTTMNRPEAPNKIDLPVPRSPFSQTKSNTSPLRRTPGGGYQSPGRTSFSNQGSPRDGVPTKQRQWAAASSPADDGRGGGVGEPEEAAQLVTATPLPVLPIIVLCVAMLGEFLAAATPASFLYFMIEDFGVGQGSEGGREAAVAFWTGIVGSVFFLSQFITSLMWTSVAEKHGKRFVLFTSLLGNAASLVIFGTCRNVKSAIVARLAMGVFNGAVGVARSAVANITDSTNEGQAVSYMALCWGLGGIIGSIIGGIAENPVRNYPGFFSNSKLFTAYPYLLPCLISGAIVFVGAIMSLFLSYDAGIREGGIRLPTEKAVESKLGLWKRRFFGEAKTSLEQINEDDERVPLSNSIATPPDTPSSQNRPIVATPPSRATGLRGTPFGSTVTGPTGQSFALRRASRMSESRPRRMTGQSDYIDRRRASVASRLDGNSGEGQVEDLNFAERLLMSNEPAVFGLAELWVANATRSDDTFSQLGLDEDVFADDDEESQIGLDDPDFFTYGGSPTGSPGVDGEDRGRSSILTQTSREQLRSRSRGTELGTLVPKKRRASVASTIPTIFANTGLDPSSLGILSPAVEHADSTYNPLEAIPEGVVGSVVRVSTPKEDGEGKSLIWQLPLGMLTQYALLALHGTICDQVFMSFLVSPIPSGGLGLKAAHYALLTALMFFFSLIWQFEFYPKVSAPRGPLTHLGMFRLGIALYIPVYLLFPELRAFLTESGNNAPVIWAMASLSAIRYLANTCCYTSIMILVNAMSPPHLVPLANGLAQSAVSLCRFIGPIIGGSLWAVSVVDGPEAHPWPFNYALGFNIIAVVCALGFLHSFRIR